jgi:ribosomal protein S18 acetylase RimI-like enzyme
MPATSRPEPTLRPARPEDAPDLVRLVEVASEGLASYVWAGMAAPGEDAVAVGLRRVARDEGAFSWRNAMMAEIDGAVAGALVTYRIAEVPEPLDGIPPIFRPLQALENLAPGTQYVNVLATYPEFRRRGVGRRLMVEAERLAAGATLSLIVSAANTTARRLYQAIGYEEVAREPFPAEWMDGKGTWVLMLRPPG